MVAAGLQAVAVVAVAAVLVIHVTSPQVAVAAVV
jgi:hypothetical protein